MIFKDPIYGGGYSLSIHVRTMRGIPGIHDCLERAIQSLTAYTLIDWIFESVSAKQHD